MTDTLVITIDDIRKTGHCTRGARRWFQHNGLSFDDFLKNGVDAQRLLDTGDALALRVVQATRERLRG
jgi:hypothetical protein